MSATHASLVSRAVCIPGWRPLPGMVTARDGTVLRIGDDGHPVTEAGTRRYEVMPDLTSPATIGCLMALAGWPSTNMAQRPWVWGRVDGVRYDGVGDSLAEALVVYAEAVGRWPGGEG